MALISYTAKHAMIDTLSPGSRQMDELQIIQDQIRHEANRMNGKRNYLLFSLFNLDNKHIEALTKAGYTVTVNNSIKTQRTIFYTYKIAW